RVTSVACVQTTGSAILAAGDNKSCTITNTRKPKLTVTKVTNPTTDSGKFNLKIDTTVFATDVGSGGTTGAQIVSIGSHTASEAAGTGTSLSDYTSVISGDCDPTTGSVTMAGGHNRSANVRTTGKAKQTITNATNKTKDS